MEARRFHDDDLDALVALANHAALGGDAELEPRTRAQLHGVLTSPETDVARDLRVWSDGDGAVGAFARAWVGPRGDETHAMLTYAIGAERDAALEEEIVRWAARRLGEAAGDGRVSRLTHVVALRDRGRADRLARLGFSVYRQRLDMGRAVLPAIEAPLPAGMTIRPVDAVAEAARYVDLFNETFCDTHDFSPLDETTFLHDTTTPDYRPDFDLVLETAGGDLAGFCYVTLDPATPGIGTIATVAVRLAWRRRGLAGCLVAAGLDALRAAGAATANLQVDVDSPNGAARVYERLGFATRFAETRLALAGDALGVMMR